MSSSKDSSRQRMPRGSSCLNCRRRRIKCDGSRPVCKNCGRSISKFGDCEYPGAGPSRTEYLEEQISILENRIRDLENPSRGSGMNLQDPYSVYTSAQSIPGMF
ncbi:hypothetical protein VKT23_009836 [Stygiomarasmius scandens]|uniref:Zn(2)-C6 fungal-type domain-containing protein n=1 Tax=Marasmiellus scandens TaxID=2682957 RepID=A0ABR1JE36_9AGAR